jgi:hypothetical protein
VLGEIVMLVARGASSAVPPSDPPQLVRPSRTRSHATPLTLGCLTASPRLTRNRLEGSTKLDDAGAVGSTSRDATEKSPPGQ